MGTCQMNSQIMWPQFSDVSFALMCFFVWDLWCDSLLNLNFMSAFLFQMFVIWIWCNTRGHILWLFAFTGHGFFGRRFDEIVTFATIILKIVCCDCCCIYNSIKAIKRFWMPIVGAKMTISTIHLFRILAYRLTIKSSQTFRILTSIRNVYSNWTSLLTYDAIWSVQIPMSIDYIR